MDQRRAAPGGPALVTRHVGTLARCDAMEGRFRHLAPGFRHLQARLGEAAPVSQHGWVRVRVERSGGFAGVVVRGEADTAALDDEQAARLRDLADRVDLAALSAAAPGPGRADRFRYDVEVRDDEPGSTHRVQVGETAVPAELRSLIDHVLRRP